MRPFRRSIRHVEHLNPRVLLSSVPWGATPDDTAEFMLGDVLVTVVLLESDGSIDANSEDWNAQQIADVKSSVVEGLRWWEKLLELQQSAHHLAFQIDFIFADNPVETGYEPITRRSDDHRLWIDDFLDVVGFNSNADQSDDIRAFNHSQRVQHETDWAFTIFVVNSEQDVDGRFAVGGEHSRAFAFAGGRHFVTTSGRPASTIAHETGHMFWAFDEYSDGKPYGARRGYYDAQNTNATQDHPSPSDRVASIMDSHTTAFANYDISPSAKEIIGWRDSDHDGVFDVLDVPFTLTGSGAFDKTTGHYHFRGHSTVQTLPNRNSSGQQSDTTINRIRTVQYRIDDGRWLDYGAFDDHEVDIELTIGPLASSVNEVSIRTLDDRSGVSSEVFHGGIDEPSVALTQGIHGYLWEDVNADSHYDGAERGLSGWTVSLRKTDGQLVGPLVVDADRVGSGEIVDSVIQGVTLSAHGPDVENSQVFAIEVNHPSTGARVFGNLGSAGPTPTWSAGSRYLRVDLEDATSTVSIDVISNGSVGYGRLEAYDHQNNLTARSTTDALSKYQVETLTATSSTPISYVLVRGHAGTSVRLDNLQLGPQAMVNTDAFGSYTFPNILPGSFIVQASTELGWTMALPAQRVVAITSTSPTVGPIRFAASNMSESLSWKNLANPLDVSGDGVISPLDVLLVFNEVNANGSRMLPQTPASGQVYPYLDVSGDGFVSAIDALLVVNHLNATATFTAERERTEPFASRGRTFEDVDAIVASATLSISEFSLTEAEDDNDVTLTVDPKMDCSPQSCSWAHLSSRVTKVPTIVRSSVRDNLGIDDFLLQSLSLDLIRSASIV